MQHLPTEVVSRSLGYLVPWEWRLTSARLVCKRWQQAVVYCAEDEMRERVNQGGVWRPVNEDTTLARVFLLLSRAAALPSSGGFLVTESLTNLCASIKEIDMYGWTAAGAEECELAGEGYFVGVSTFSPPRRITDQGLKGVGKLRTIEKLILTNCTQLTDAGIVELQPLDRLTEINLTSSDQITSDGVISLPNLANLEALEVHSCGLLLEDAAVEKLAQQALRLRHLILSECNQITDDGLRAFSPAWIDTLHTLDLSWCLQLTDSALYEHIGRLSNLKRLVLQGCLVTDDGVITLANRLRCVEELVLRDTEISDSTGYAIGSLAELRLLDISKCKKLSSAFLVHLIQGDTASTTRVPDRLTKLDTLNCFACRLMDDDDIKALAMVPSLTTLNLSQCPGVTDVTLAELLPALHKLQVLDVSSDKSVTDLSLVNLSALSERNLKSLNLGRTGTSDKGLVQLCRTWPGIGTLVDLDLTALPLVTDEGLEAISPSCTGLKRLCLAHCSGITGVGIGSLSRRLTQLESLDLSSCKGLTDGALIPLSQLPALTDLRVGCNEWLTDDGLSSLTALRAILKLDVETCHSITDAGLKGLATIPRLRELIISFCMQLTDECLESVAVIHGLCLLEVAVGDGITQEGVEALVARGLFAVHWY